MVITILLWLLLFTAGLINIYFYVPSKKLIAWLQSFLPTITQPPPPPPPPPPISSAKTSPSHKEKSGGGGAHHDKAELKSVFATFDKNGDGFITKQELRESLKNIGIFLSEKEVEDMVVKVDSNGDGLIDLDEFCILYKAVAGDDDIGEHQEDGAGEGDLKEAFDVFDRDKDGLISVEELGSVLSSLGLKEGRKFEDLKEMIRKVDMDGDGMVNFDEFKRMMRGGGKLVSVF
ncbi:hypothetical protein Tsubulata_001796 [Turnera subulata]|uniref:EF-hand domain-containing protein n=1 Tax=Turnera subulata TaxID=218843 RepID=A0A9Q0FGJ5_9ROSI|nr:hypothetical protein Tsubulata_001796 [Turnera subulata]